MKALIVGLVVAILALGCSLTPRYDLTTFYDYARDCQAMPQGSYYYVHGEYKHMVDCFLYGTNGKPIPVHSVEHDKLQRQLCSNGKDRYPNNRSGYFRCTWVGRRIR